MDKNKLLDISNLAQVKKTKWVKSLLKVWSITNELELTKLINNNIKYECQQKS